MEFDGHKDFFDTVGGDFISVKIYGIATHITVEQLYLAFKERLLAELQAQRNES